MSTQEQREAMELFRAALAPLGGVRIEADAEGWPMAPGRRGRLEWFCDGQDCHSCPLPGAFALAVYTHSRTVFAGLDALPGVRRHQIGDRERRYAFVPTPETLAVVDALIRVRRRRRLSPEHLAKLRAGLDRAARLATGSVQPVSAG